MGLGGHLTWTPAIREIHNKISRKIIPCEIRKNNQIKITKSEIFKNNPYVYHGELEEIENPDEFFFLPMNLKETNYCWLDTPNKAFHKFDKHIIQTICNFYEIENPDLKCEIYFDEAEEKSAKDILKELEKDFIVIEPNSKKNYTPNREYPFEKWQKVVDDLSKSIQVVQLGTSGSKVLEKVVDLTGRTNFRTASCVIRSAKCLVTCEGGLVHAANAVETKSVVVITGYQSPKMVAYPENINIDISSHGPCGLKVKCKDCESDAARHDYKEIVKATERLLNS